MTISRFSFSAGDKNDASQGIHLVVDRSALPAGMKLGLWLDDEGHEIPGLERVRRDRNTGALGQRNDCGARFVLLERTRIGAQFGCATGVLTAEAGTRLDVGGGALTTPMRLKGGLLAVRNGRRFAEIRDERTVLEVDREPNEVHVFTLEAEEPPGAEAGAEYQVEVRQTTTSGKLAGAVAVNFKFD